MADDRIVTELSSLQLQVQGLAEQRKADKAKEHDNERAAMIERIKELERQRAMDLLKAHTKAELLKAERNAALLKADTKAALLKAELARKDATLLVQRHLTTLQHEMDLIKHEKIHSEMRLQHQLDQERGERRAQIQRLQMQLQIQQLAHQLTAAPQPKSHSVLQQLTAVADGFSVPPTPSATSTQVDDARLAKITAKKAALAEVQRQLLADQHELQAQQEALQAEAAATKSGLLKQQEEDPHIAETRAGSAPLLSNPYGDKQACAAKLPEGSLYHVCGSSSFNNS